MATGEKQERRDLPLILVALALVLFASPFVYWWTNPDMPWYVPYLLWLGVIFLGGWSQWRRSHHEP